MNVSFLSPKTHYLVSVEETQVNEQFFIDCQLACLALLTFTTDLPKVLESSTLEKNVAHSFIPCI